MNQAADIGVEPQVLGGAIKDFLDGATTFIGGFLMMLGVIAVLLMPQSIAKAFGIQLVVLGFALRWRPREAGSMSVRVALVIYSLLSMWLMRELMTTAVKEINSAYMMVNHPA